MTDDEIGALIAVVGLVSQLAGAVLLTGLFAALLRSHPRPQPYFRQWTLGWAALVVALCGVGIQYALPQVMAAEPLAARAANLVYQAGKLLFVALLLAGTLNFVRGNRSRVFMRWAIPVSLGYALVSVDMDNLKVVNDTEGHAAGDELLRRLVETLRRCVRPLARIYRWGGDEFLLLFPAALPEEVLPRVREALRAVRELEASVGAARFSGTDDLPAAIERADRAMYEEKARNRAAAGRGTSRPERLAALRKTGGSNA